MMVPSAFDVIWNSGVLAGAFGRDQRADRRLGRVEFGGVAQLQQDAVLVRLGIQRLVEDTTGSERLTDTIDHAVQPLFLHGLHVHFEQQIGTAAQVEAEMHLPPRHPGRRRREQIGNAEDQAKQAKP